MAVCSAPLFGAQDGVVALGPGEIPHQQVRRSTICRMRFDCCATGAPRARLMGTASLAGGNGILPGSVAGSHAQLAASWSPETTRAAGRCGM